MLKRPHRRLDGHCYDVVWAVWRAWVDAVRPKGCEELSAMGRDILDDLGWTVSATLLIEDARRDDDKIAAEVATRWVETKIYRKNESSKWEEKAEWDKIIVFGDEMQLAAKL